MVDPPSPSEQQEPDGPPENRRSGQASSADAEGSPTKAVPFSEDLIMTLKVSRLSWYCQQACFWWRRARRSPRRAWFNGRAQCSRNVPLLLRNSPSFSQWSPRRERDSRGWSAWLWGSAS